MSLLRIAYFSLLPPQPSGIADYSTMLLPTLAQVADVKAFVDIPDMVTAGWDAPVPVLPIDDYSKHQWSIDMALYQLGNNRMHASHYEMALQYPGVVALHDYGLHHFVQDHATRKGGSSSYSREFAYEAGVAGWRTAEQVRMGRLGTPVYTYSLNSRLLDSSLGIIGHSQYVVDRVMAQHSHRPAKLIPHLDLLAGQSVDSQRDRLSVGSDTTVFVSAGYLSPVMQIEFALRAFANVLKSGQPVHYVLVGKLHDVSAITELIGLLGIEEAVTLVGYVDDLNVFNGWLAAADVVINLRQPTLGETSGIGIRALAIGRPLILFNHGWYGELPDAVAWKVPVMELDQLENAMLTLAQDHTRRTQMGEAAAAHMRAHHRPEQIASQTIDFVKQILNGIHEKLQ